MAITGAQCRAAQALLGWKQGRVVAEAEAEAEAEVAHRTLVDFERGLRKPMAKNLTAIRTAFEAAGIVFIEDNGGGRGVRFSAPQPEVPGADGSPVASDDEP